MSRDVCAKPGCGLLRRAHHSGLNQDNHNFVEPVESSDEATARPKPLCDLLAASASQGEYMAILQAWDHGVSFGVAAGRAAAFTSLNIDDETLVAEVAFEVGQATKQQPHMGGKCRGGHGEQENRRIARAAIRAISRAGGTK